MPLTWREGQLGDRTELQAFVCADPPDKTYVPNRGEYHPTPWAHEVQSYVRDLRPPVTRRREWLAIGRDSEGVASVAHFGNDSDGAGHFVIMIVARDERCAGLGYGRDALDYALAQIADLKPDSEACTVYARIHPKNADSRSMATAAGFENLGPVEKYDMWTLDM